MLTDKENPVCARVCFLIDPQINPSTHSVELRTCLLRTGWWAIANGGVWRPEKRNQRAEKTLCFFGSFRKLCKNHNQYHVLCKIKVRHMLFKKISFFNSLK